MEPPQQSPGSHRVQLVLSSEAHGAADEDSSAAEVTASESEVEHAAKVRGSFNAPAHWMIVFGAVLAVCAGIIDVTAMLQIGFFISHMTGLVAKVGMQAEGVRFAMFAPTHPVDGSPETSVVKAVNDLWEAAAVLSSFIFGAFLTGLVIPKNLISFGGKSFYGAALIGESALLLVAMFFAMRPDHACDLQAACSMACACGLQNAMCTMHLGAIVRTTHVTGTATDIGSTTGRAVMILLRRTLQPKRFTYLDAVELEVDMKKLRVLLSIFFSFALGCFIGSFLYTNFGAYTLLFPACATGLGGVLYTFFREAMKRQFLKFEARRLARDMEEATQIIERTDAFLRRQRTRSSSGSGSADTIVELDAQMVHALQVLHTLEEAIYDYCTDEEDGERPRSPSRVRRAATQPARSGSEMESGTPRRTQSRV